jgi:sugar phosphate isomerase/epimerase
MPKVSVEGALAGIAELGYQGVELAVTPGWSAELYTLDAAKRAQIRKLLEHYGLVLTAVAGHTSLCADDPEENRRNMQRLKDTVDLAADLGQTGEPPIMVSLVGGRPEDWETHRRILAERVNEIAEYARSRGVIYAMEPHSGTALDLPDKITWLFEQVHSPALRLNFDISHMEVMGISIDECVPILAPLSVHTHVKDQRGVFPHHEFLTPGEGPFQFVHYLQAMDAARYKGFIVAEVSVMVQRRVGYEPFSHAALAYRTLVTAFEIAGLDYRSK